MKLTVIGYWGGFPKAGEATSSYLLEHKGYKLLLECGSGVVSSLQKIIDIGELNSVLLTHYHYDHCCDIGPLQYAWQIKTQLDEINEILPIYAPADGFFNLLKWENYTIGNSFTSDGILNLGPFEISFIRAIHPVECYCVKIKCEDKILSFTSDTAYFDELGNFFKNSKLLLSECSFYEEMDGSEAGHLNSRQAGMLAENSNSEMLVLTHLPHFGNTDDLIDQAGKYYKGKIILAKQFLELNI